MFLNISNKCYFILLKSETSILGDFFFVFYISYDPQFIKWNQTDTRQFCP